MGARHRVCVVSVLAAGLGAMQVLREVPVVRYEFKPLNHCHFDCKLGEYVCISVVSVSALVNRCAIARGRSIYNASSTWSQFFLLSALIPQCFAVTCTVPIIHLSSVIQMSRISWSGPHRRRLGQPKAHPIARHASSFRTRCRTAVEHERNYYLVEFHLLITVLHFSV